MAEINMSDANCRALASFGMVAAGTTVATLVTGGAAPAIGAALAGLFGNVWAGDLTKVWDDRRRSPRYAHPNHDLVKLTGDAVSLVLHGLSRESDEKTRKRWLEKVADQAATSYPAIAGHPAFADIGSDRFCDLFAAAANEAGPGPKLLDEPRWRLFVEFLRDEAKLVPNDEAERTAANALTRRLFAALRECVKRDFAGEGRAYAALTLDLHAGTLASLTKLDGDHQALRQDLALLKEAATRAFHASRRALPAERQADLAWLVTETTGIVRRLTCRFVRFGDSNLSR